METQTKTQTKNKTETLMETQTKNQIKTLTETQTKTETKTQTQIKRKRSFCKGASDLLSAASYREGGGWADVA